MQLDRTRWWLTGGGLFEVASSVTLTRGYGEAGDAFQQATSMPGGIANNKNDSVSISCYCCHVNIVLDLVEHNVVALRDSGQAVVLNGGQEKVWMVDVRAEPFT